MTAAPITEVVIVGRDAPLWLAASVVQRALGPAGVTVQAVELPSR
ncbi:MAG: Tryptophan halogenase, partial [Caulobacter sp.]|nr:Tryptophan halogenase [Caulobacter sp.]